MSVRGDEYSVISRPPQTAYDVLLIDAGTESGIKKEMIVKIGDIYLGKIEKVFNNLSRVRLASNPDNEIDAMLSSTNLFTKAIGQGGGNFKITLPRDVEVNIGDYVLTVGSEPLLIGIVEKIKKSPTDVFQKILFRAPINLQTLRFVQINTNPFKKL